MLVLRPGALGDTLLAVPALRSLRRRFTPITLAAHAGAARLLRELDEVDDALSFDDPRMAKLLAGERADEPVVAWAQGVQLRDAVLVAPSRPAGEVHCARYLLDTLAPLGCDQQLDDRPLRIAPIRSDEVLVHPGSGGAAKNWPAACFARLIERLPAVRLIVGEADTAVAAEVERCVERQLPKLEHPPLAELARRLAGCPAYVGNDSGVSHLAGLCGARSFVLFGHTSPAVWRPLGPHVTVRDFATRPEDLVAEIDP